MGTRLAIFDAEQNRETFSAYLPHNPTMGQVHNAVNTLRVMAEGRVHYGWINEYDTDHSRNETINKHDL